MAPTDEQIRLAIAQQAAEWFVAQRTSSLDDAGQTAFAAWLKTSPVHVDEYLRMAAISSELRATVQDPQLPIAAWVAEATAETAGLEPPNVEGPGAHRGTPNVIPLRPSITSHDKRRGGSWLPSGWRLAGALAIPAIVAGALFLSFLLSGTPAQAYETAHGQQRTWQLPDGTTLRLNTDSAVEVRLSATERQVDLSRGQAFFRVSRDPRRRFRVSAGGAEVVAVGTQFDVYRHGRTVQVTVLAGRVAVFSGHAPPPGGSALPAATLELAAGQQLRIVGGVMESKPASVDVHEAEAWLRGQIAFERRPLGEVAAEFNRYGPVPIEIDEPSLRAMPVSGVFDARDSASFLDFLQSMKGVGIERSPTRIRVFVRRTPAGL